MKDQQQAGTEEFLTYDNLVKYFKQKVRKIKKSKISVVAINLSNKQQDTIIENTNKNYNCAFVIYDPNYLDPYGKSMSSRYEQESYFCHSLEEFRDVLNFLFSNYKEWTIKISQKDALEQKIYN